VIEVDRMSIDYRRRQDLVRLSLTDIREAARLLRVAAKRLDPSPLPQPHDTEDVRRRVLELHQQVDEAIRELRALRDYDSGQETM